MAYAIKEIMNHLEAEAEKEDDMQDDIITRSIQTTGEGFDIIAGHRNLSNALAEFSDTTDVFLLKELISCMEDYDYILIDSAPARSPLLNMGYVAADYCLILTEADKASQDGVKQVVTGGERPHPPPQRPRQGPGGGMAYLKMV